MNIVKTSLDIPAETISVGFGIHQKYTNTTLHTLLNNGYTILSCECTTNHPYNESRNVIVSEPVVIHGTESTACYIKCYNYGTAAVTDGFTFGITLGKSNS